LANNLHFVVRISREYWCGLRVCKGANGKSWLESNMVFTQLQEKIMNYDKAELRKIAMEILEKGQDDLRENGSIRSGAIALDRNGVRILMPLGFKTEKQKRQVQANLKELLRTIDARAVVMMSEMWVSLTPREGFPRGTRIEDIPGRREALFVNARSASARFQIVQVFTKKGSEVTFQDPVETDRPAFRDDWLDGVWDNKN